MLSQRASARIGGEIKRYMDAPAEFVPRIAVDEHNQRHLYYLLEGFPDSSPFAGGQYVVMMKLHEDYPFKAPSIQLLTPNGRFIPNNWICISGLTHFHAETWCPLLTFTTIMAGFVSFWFSEYSGEVGGQRTTTEEKQALAAASHEFNKKKGLLTPFN